MTLGRARIVRASPAVERAEPLVGLAPSAGQRRRIARDELEARLAAEAVLREARVEAERLVRQARDRAALEAAEISREAREREEARLGAAWIALRVAEQDRLRRDADRVVATAVALAERLLGAALEMDPSRIRDLAQTAVAEAKGARHIVIEANPKDAESLLRSLAAVGADGSVVDVRPSDALARGDLRLQTDVGTIDANLAPRLERLAAALRDAIK